MDYAHENSLIPPVPSCLKDENRRSPWAYPHPSSQEYGKTATPSPFFPHLPPCGFSARHRPHHFPHKTAGPSPESAKGHPVNPHPEKQRHRSAFLPPSARHTAHSAAPHSFAGLSLQPKDTSLHSAEFLPRCHPLNRHPQKPSGYLPTPAPVLPFPPKALSAHLPSPLPRPLHCNRESR